MRRCLLAFAAATALVGAPAYAQAPPPPPPPPAQPADTSTSLGDSLGGVAKTEYLAGKGLFNDGDYKGALVKFQSALEASGEKRLYWNLAACERGLRHYAQAIRYLERYKAEGGPQVTDKDRSNADELIGGLRPFVAAITVRSNEDGATVLVDDREVGKTPVEKLLVDLGDHRLVIKKQGFDDHAEALAVTGTADMVLKFDIVAAHHEGRLVINAGTNDSIAVDGAVVASGTYGGTLPSGTHVVRVTGEGKKPYDARVAVEDGQVRSLDVTLERVESGLPAWAWIGIGVAGASALSVGAYFLFRGDDTKTNEPVKGTMPPQIVQLPAFRGHLH